MKILKVYQVYFSPSGTTKKVVNEIARAFKDYPTEEIDLTRYENRQFTAMDLMPTTLAAMGYTIPGDRLGLGTNLFSDRETLCEEFGFFELNAELYRHSQFYLDKLIGGD